MAKTESVNSIWSDFRAKYEQTTPKKIKLIDGFLAYVLATGILQFIYCALVGTFPFNSFLSGFVCTVGVFVLAGKSLCFFFLSMTTLCIRMGRLSSFELCWWCRTVSLRMQINPENEFKDRTEQRAFADYLFCNIILFLVVFNFMG